MQRPVEDNQLEYIIDDHFARVRALKPGGSQGDKYPEYAEHGREYKKSVTLSKLRRLYRYGWKLAEQLVPTDESRWTNGEIMGEFMTYWSKLCKANAAEEVAQYYRGITVSLFRDAQGLLHWQAEFQPAPGATIMGADDLELDVTPLVLKGGPDGAPSQLHILP